MVRKLDRRSALAALAAGVVAGARAAPGAETPPRPVFQKGFTFSAWTSDAYLAPQADQQLAALRACGVEWLSLVTHWYQPRLAATTIAPDANKTPSDESLVHAIGVARRLGLQVLLKPQVDPLKGGWRGEIAFRQTADWDAWFASYRQFILHYAELAEREHLAMLCVGVELDGARHQDARWRDVIAAVRQEFHGPLVYAANWGRETDMRWWDALDYAGVDAYYPLVKEPAAQLDRARLMRGWQPHLERLRAWQKQIDRPVLFTEIGYRSVRGAAAQPWEWQQAGQPAADEQALLYEAALETFWREPWFHGFYWWQWDTQPPEDPANDTSYTPQGKPALGVLKAAYERQPWHGPRNSAK